MIVSSAPLRVSFNGGGSDLPAYFEHQVGNCLTLTINKNVYVAVNKSFGEHYRVAYSQIEVVKSIEEIRHPIIRNSLKILGVKDFLEILSIADVPSNGSGLGSSSAFTIALLSSLSRYLGEHYSGNDLAEMACEVELKMCDEPIGKQDQYAIAHGGLNHFIFDSEKVSKLEFGLQSNEIKEIIKSLNELAHFYQIDRPRNASSILSVQKEKLIPNSQAFLTTTKISELSVETRIHLLNRNYEAVGSAMSEGWLLKSQLNGDIDDPEIRRLQRAINLSGAYGGKLLGAGQGGFVVVLAPKHLTQTINDIMSPYKRVDFEFSENEVRTWELK